MNMQMRNHFFRPGNALRLSAALLLAALAAGCAKEPDSGIRGTELLVVGSALENPEGKPSAAAASTRAAETNGVFTFGNGDALGLFMRGAAYADVDNRKVVYTKPGSAAGTWAIEGSPILLNDQTAVVSLVYPHTAGAAYDNIPFTAGVYSPNKDLLWKQQDVYAAVNEAQVTQMKHALARVKFVVKCDDPSDTSVPDRFTGTGAVTSVSIADAGAGSNVIFEDGVLDLSFTAPASPVRGNRAGMLEDKTAFTLSATGHTADFLTLPIAAMSADLVGLYIRVDGQILSTSLPAAAPADKWEAGSCYTYTVTVKNKGIEVTSSTVDNWTDGTPGGSDVEKPVPPAVGNYYYSDGTMSKTLKPGKTVEGVVFWVNPDNPQHYKVVGKSQAAGKTWGPNPSDFDKSYDYNSIRMSYNYVDAPGRQSGFANRDFLHRWIYDRSANTAGKTMADFPAFKNCDDLGKGWYLPALNELQYLCCALNGWDPDVWKNAPSVDPDRTARNAFNALLTAAGGDIFDLPDVYWSSVEKDNTQSYVQYFDGDRTGNSVAVQAKDQTARVRCIRQILPPPSVNDRYYLDGTTSKEWIYDIPLPGAGLVIWVDPADPAHFKVLSLTDAQKNFSEERFDVGMGAYAGIRDGSRDGDVDSPARVSGKTNREILGRWIADNSANTGGKTIADFPAFEYCDRMGREWYLPAVNELQYLYCISNNAAPVTWTNIRDAPAQNRDAQSAFNSLFGRDGVGISDVDKVYVSSTEYSNYQAWQIIIDNGLTDAREKNGNPSARCIRDVQQ